MALWLMINQHYGYLFYTPSNLELPILETPIIAALLAINFTFIVWLWSQVENPSRQTFWYQGVSRKIAQVFLLAYWIGTGAALFRGFQLLFMGHLLVEWLVD